jgi:hypothetical protein
VEPIRDDDIYSVGREHLLHLVIRDLEPDRAARAGGLISAVGLGKTTLLRRIRDAAGSSAHDTVLLDLTVYEPGHAGRSSAKLTYTGAQQNFDALKVRPHRRAAAASEPRRSHRRGSKACTRAHP